MSMDRLQLCLLLSLTGVLFVTSMGFASPQAADGPNPEQLVLEAVESTNNESIQGVRTEVFQRADQFEMVTVEVTEAPPTRSRVEVIDAIQTDPQSDLTVINGSTRWQYFRESQQAVRTEAAGQWQSDQQFGTNDRELLNDYVVEYEGTETVEERETHIVEITPPEPRNLELSLDIQTENTEYEFELQDANRGRWYITEETWWIDTETSYPVKQRIEWTDEDGETIATTIRTYHELTVGADVNREAFGFEPPQGVEVSQPTLPETGRYPTRHGAADAAGFEIPEPAVPDSYELHEATVQEFESGTSVMLTYQDGTETLTVHVSERSTRGDRARIVKQGVGSVDGQLSSVDGRPSLTWECGSLSHRVSGLRDVDALTAVADSIGCQSSVSGETTNEGSTTSGESPVDRRFR